MKAVVTVIGKDTKGIIAGISTCLSERDINILDISQQVMEDIFSMVMLVDLKDSTEDLQMVRESLDARGSELGVKTHIMRKDLFNSMHRI
ncbi:MAG: ACT domain-containing protein [Eubacteriales bacterium]